MKVVKLLVCYCETGDGGQSIGIAEASGKETPATSGGETAPVLDSSPPRAHKPSWRCCCRACLAAPGLMYEPKQDQVVPVPEEPSVASDIETHGSYGLRKS